MLIPNFKRLKYFFSICVIQLYLINIFSPLNYSDVQKKLSDPAILAKLTQKLAKQMDELPERTSTMPNGGIIWIQ